MRRSGTAMAGGLAVAVAAALAGCTSGNDVEPTASPTVDRSVPMYVDQVDPDEQPIAEFTAEAAGDAEGEAEVQVLSLEVTGDVMLLRVAVTPLPLDDEGSSDRVSLFELCGFFWNKPTLYDVEHMVLYKPLETDFPSAYSWRADDVGNALPQLSRGHPFLFWVYFDAPDDRVGQLDLTFNENWPVVEDVPVVRS